MKNNKWRNRLIAAGVAVVGVCICLTVAVASSASRASPTATNALAVAIAATETAPPAPTATGPTAKPSATFQPTFTPRPTVTPRPSATASPIASVTFTPPPDPIVLTGNGDDIVDVENPFEFGLLRITGNAGGRLFTVTSFDDNNNQLEGLVLTTDPYSGTRPLDIRSGQHTVRFEVKAVGAWTIELAPLSTIRRLEVPGTIEGVGDDVIGLIGAAPDTATITGNPNARLFVVTGWGSRSTNLVLTTDVYDGKVIVKPDTVLLEIQAIGPWSIQVDN